MVVASTWDIGFNLVDIFLFFLSDNIVPSRNGNIPEGVTTMEYGLNRYGMPMNPVHLR